MNTHPTDLWVFPLADLLQMDLKLRQKKGHTILEASRDMKFDIGKGVVLSGRVESRGGWTRGSEVGSRQAILLLKIKTRLYAMVTYGEASNTVAIHLINRDKVRSGGYIEDNVEIGDSIRETYGRLKNAIFASYARKVDGPATWLELKPGEKSAVPVGSEATGDQQAPVPPAGDGTS